MANKNGAFRKRFDFSKIPATIQIPNLIEVQRRSYDRFLQMDKLPSERDDAGLQAVLDGTYKRGRRPALWDGRAAERIAAVLVNGSAAEFGARNVH